MVGAVYVHVLRTLDGDDDGCEKGGGVKPRLDRCRGNVGWVWVLLCGDLRGDLGFDILEA